jgi:hypothetical protein
LRDVHVPMAFIAEVGEAATREIQQRDKLLSHGGHF